MSDPGWFSGDPFPSGEPNAATPLFGEQDRYELRAVLGIGGMGRVHIAWDRRLHREVAFKVVTDPAHARRMAREAWITAQLEHPGIVEVHDAGRTPDGQPFYTMRLIRGRTLAASLGEAQTPEERLAYMPHFLAACQAVAFAHDVGIVHRDLKPANLLVGRFGETQVADWGLARPVPQAEEDWSRVVLEGAPDPEPAGTVVGTPRYMAPEQARGESCDPRADVWSLGVVLHELLSGQRSFAEHDTDTVLERRRRGEGPPLDALEAPVELVAIVRRATQADPAERYPDALALAEDVQRWLEGRRVLAHAYSSAELLQRLVRAWRGPLLVGAVGLGVLVFAGVLANHRLAAERDLAQAYLGEAEAHLADALTAQAITAHADDARPEAEVLAAHALLHGERSGARGVLAATAPSPRPTRVAPLPLPLPCQDGNAVPSPDRTALACLGQQQLLVWELDSGETRWLREDPAESVWWLDDETLLVKPPAQHLLRRSALNGEAIGSSVSTLGGEVVPLDGAHALTVQGPTRQVVPLDGGPATTHDVPDCHVYDLHPAHPGWLGFCSEGGLRRFDAAHPEGIPVALPFTPPDPSTVVPWHTNLMVATFSGQLHHIEGDEEVSVAVDSPVMQVLPVPGRSLVLIRGERGGPRIYDPQRRSWVGRLPAGARTLAAGARDGEVWLMGETLERWTFPQDGHPAALQTGPGITSVAWTPGGESLVFGGADSEVGIVDVATGRLRARQRLSEEPRVVKSVAVSPDGLIVASAIEHGTYRLSLQDPRPVPILDGPGPLVFRRVNAVAGGFVGLSYSAVLRWFDAEGTVMTQHGTAFTESATDEDGAWVALLSRHQEIWTAEVQTQELQRRFAWPEGGAVELDRGARHFWLSRQQELCRTDASGTLQRCQALDSLVIDVALSPDEALVAAGTRGGEVWVLDAKALTPLAHLAAHDARAVAVAFSPDGRMLASGGWDGRVQFWDLSVLDRAAASLVTETTTAWDLDLDGALGTVATPDEMSDGVTR